MQFLQMKVGTYKKSVSVRNTNKMSKIIRIGTRDSELALMASKNCTNLN